MFAFGIFVQVATEVSKKHNNYTCSSWLLKLEMKENRSIDFRKYGHIDDIANVTSK